jgi:hypothetical protein
VIEIQGADQLAQLSRQLKETAARGLRRELSKALNEATKPVKQAARESARDILPRHGGLNEKVANSKFTTRRSANGLRVQAKNSYALKRLDEGVLQHPVFGHREHWVTQRVTAGWWSTPMEKLAPTAREEISRAMQRIADQIGRGV